MHIYSIAIAILGLVHHTLSWGDLGHRTVALLAYKYLTPDTASYLDNILANDQGFDFSDAATWADIIKRGRPYTEPWHFIDAIDSPPQKCYLTYPNDCTNKGCIISALSNQTSLFITSSDDTTRREALMFVLHFLGDIHQPLHVESAYRGGNEIPVCFGHACSKNNLHSVWDKYIPHKICGLKNAPTHDEEKVAAGKWADALFSEQVAKGASLVNECSDVQRPDTCTLAWAREVNLFVCSTAMKESVDWLESNDLSLEYYDDSKAVVELLIGKAGVRLAAWLEAMVAASANVFGGEVDHEPAERVDL